MKTTIIVLVFLAIVLTACGPAATPIPTTIPWDTDKDGMLTPAELGETFKGMNKILDAIALTKPAEAEALKTEVAKYQEALKNNPLEMDLFSIQQTANKILTLVDAINKSQGK